VTWRKREGAAAAALRRCRAALAERGSNALREATGGDPAAAWRHYPAGEVYDPASHAQYFFHRHAEEDRPRRAAPAEHGHFHLFLGGDGMPAGIAPLLLPELAIANAPAPPPSAPLRRGTRAELCHLLAIAIDARGEPVRLFTTNRWVTGETWYAADDVIRMLDCFRLPSQHPPSLLDRWLTALVQLFQPEIAALLQRRDKTITEWRWRRRGNVYEDTRLEVISSLDIDLDARLAAVEAAQAAPAAATRRRPRLPPMAEGWGA
jgi:Domain of unknown function (DUF6969)